MKKHLIASLLLVASGISYGDTFIEVIVVPKGQKLTVDTRESTDWKEINEIKGVVKQLMNFNLYVQELNPGMYFTDNFRIPWEANGYYKFTVHKEETGTDTTYYLQERHDRLYVFEGSKGGSPLYTLYAGQVNAVVGCDGKLYFSRYNGK